MRPKPAAPVHPCIKRLPMYPQHLASLLTRGIAADVAAAAGYQSLSASAGAAELYGSGSESSLPGDAIWIPYRDLDGAPMSGDDSIAYGRLRVLDSSILPPGQKPMTYRSRQGAGSRPYLPAGLVGMILGGYRHLTITEGEFKAQSAVAHHIPCAAIAGVTMWGAPGTSGPEKGPMSDDTPVHPELIGLAKRFGGCVVLADSDATSNKSVERHMRMLAAAIQKQAGVPCAYMHIPGPAAPKSRRKKGEPEAEVPKIGLDDWIVQERGETAAIVQALAVAFAAAKKRKETVDGPGGFVALGYSGELNYVWSKPRGCLVAIGGAGVTNSGTLLNLAGGEEWCKAAYGKYNTHGDFTPDWVAMGGAIVADCIAAGEFDPKNVRGAGVWEDGGALVVNSSAGLWRSDGAKMERYGHSALYPKHANLGVRGDTPHATSEQVAELVECLKTWTWQSPSDVKLILGWLCYGYLCGAVKWRPHMSLTGSAGTGKSELQRLITLLLGYAGVAYDGSSSEAGIRQAVGDDAQVLVLDEAEADGKKVANLLTFLRSASDNKLRAMGTQDQTGKTFSMRAMGLVSGIVPPMLSAADSSRFVRIELGALRAAVAESAHILVADEDATRELGLGLYARMIGSWDRLNAAIKLLRPRMGGTTRYRDAMAPIIAAAWVAMHDGEMSDADAAAEISSLSDDANSARMGVVRDESNALAHLMGKAVDVRIDGRSMTATIASIASAAYAEVQRDPRGGEYSRALGVYGLRVVEARVGEVTMAVLQVDCGSPQMRDLYRGTAWDLGDLSVVLKRVAGAYAKNLQTTSRIGGRSCRPVVIELADLEPYTPPGDDYADLGG